MNTKTLLLFLVVAAITLGGCGFRAYVRDARDPALSVEPPCYSGDVCASAPYNGFAWAADAMHSAGH